MNTTQRAKMLILGLPALSLVVSTASVLHQTWRSRMLEHKVAWTEAEMSRLSKLIPSSGSAAESNAEDHHDHSAPGHSH